MIFQIGISSWGGIRKLPRAFSEQGVAMLSGVLHSERAIKVNIHIMRVFTRMRNIFASHEVILRKLEDLEKKDIEQDDKILIILEYITLCGAAERQLASPILVSEQQSGNRAQ